jgi:hypothetical protein
VTVISAFPPPRQKSPKPQHYCQINGSCVPTTSHDANNHASTEHPRHRFRKDHLSFIRTLQQDNHEIVLMGDFNEEYFADPEGMIEIATVCSLADIFHRQLGSSQLQHSSGEELDLIMPLCQQGQLPPYDNVVLNLPHFASKATTEVFSWNSTQTCYLRIQLQHWLHQILVMCGPTTEQTVLDLSKPNSST